jgi:hypothetical protein
MWRPCFSGAVDKFRARRASIQDVEAADGSSGFVAAEASRTVVPRDEVIIMDAYECNRQMGREEKYK